MNVELKKFFNIKEELNNVFYGYLFSEMDKVNQEEIYDKIYNILKKYDLEELKFTLVFNQQEISLEPVRTIDKLALIGINSL